MAKTIGLLFCFSAITAVPRIPTFDGPDMFVVWNVGQGQWSTLVSGGKCLHFDMGGEWAANLPTVSRLCRDSRNSLWLSHGDWDHINFIGRSRRALPDLCLAMAPPSVRSRRKRQLLAAVKSCASPGPAHGPSEVWRPRADEKSPNGQSRVVAMAGVLIPGDSLAAQEKSWALAPRLRRVHTLLAGHHGSRTSTSNFLLARLPELRQAISSSRRARYGHPHFEVETRLRERHIPLISTEDWGSIRMDWP
jgi:competence protein ComEC